MAVTTITKQTLTAQGLNITWTSVPSTDGIDFLNEQGEVILLVRNNDSSSCTAAVVTPASVGGQAIADISQAIPASEDYGFQFKPSDIFVSPTTGKVTMTFTNVTDLEVALIEKF